MQKNKIQFHVNLVNIINFYFRQTDETSKTMINNNLFKAWWYAVLKMPIHSLIIYLLSCPDKRWINIVPRIANTTKTGTSNI